MIDAVVTDSVVVIGAVVTGFVVWPVAHRTEFKVSYEYIDRNTNNTFHLEYKYDLFYA